MPDNAIRPLVEELDRWLRTSRPSYYACLKPPLTDSELGDLESVLRGPLPSDLQALYRWKGGQLSGPEMLYEDKTFMQPGEIGIGVRSMNELKEGGEFPSEEWWQPQWIPFLTDGLGNFVCVDEAGTFTGNRSQVITFRHDGPERNIEFPDLSSFLAGLLAGYEAALARGALESATISYPAGYPIRRKAN